MNRRHFLKTTSLAGATALLPHTISLQAGPAKGSRAFTLDLNPGIIGVKASQKELLKMAIRYGYESITPMPQELANYSDEMFAKVLAMKDEHNIGWGSTNLPVEFRESEEQFTKDLSSLATHAAAMRRAGATRMNTWIMPTHPTLHYTANLKRHADRLRQCGEILGEYGVLLGLEYVGPKTLMARDRFSFIRTMVELQDLLARIDLPSVGYVLDSFHWYCAEDTVEQILALDPATIASVDINDARSDLTRDEQIDGTRELPLASGVIDLKPFLKALVTIGYSGPVRSEPFNKALNEMEDEAALKTNYEAMRQAFDLID